MAIWGAALSGLGALGKLGTGIVQGIRANKIDRNNIRPTQQVQQEYFQNVQDANQMARLGLPQQQYNLARQNILRNQSNALGLLNRSANPAAGLNAMLRAGNDATLNLDVQNAQARNQNLRSLMGQRQILAGQKQNAFDWNEKSKYLVQAAKAQALRGAGIQNTMGAFGDVQQIGMALQNQEDGQGGVGGNAGISTFLPNATTSQNTYNPMYGTGNYFQGKQPMGASALTYNNFRL